MYKCVLIHEMQKAEVISLCLQHLQIDIFGCCCEAKRKGWQSSENQAYSTSGIKCQHSTISLSYNNLTALKILYNSMYGTYQMTLRCATEEFGTMCSTYTNCEG